MWEATQKKVRLMNVDYMFVIEFESYVRGLKYCSVGYMWYTFHDDD